MIRDYSYVALCWRNTLNNAVQYEFAEVLKAGEDFKISLFFDDYGNQVTSKALIDSSDESALSRLNSQAEFLKNSQHPSIANFRDYTANELFMEAMAGDIQTLAKNLGKQFSAGETVSFMRQMLTLLSHLDSRGLTAGQFSPRTILGKRLNISGHRLHEQLVGCIVAKVCNRRMLRVFQKLSLCSQSRQSRFV